MAALGELETAEKKVPYSGRSARRQSVVVWSIVRRPFHACEHTDAPHGTGR